MKTISTAFRFASVSTLIAIAGLIASPANATDAANAQLASFGVIPVKTAGPYVEIGTLRIQVSTKLGRPSTVLRDGTWLYDSRMVERSEARGTLVVRFNGGKVSELALVTPAVALAMRDDPQKPLGSYLVATK
jgi:hypothetical protein